MDRERQPKFTRNAGRSPRIWSFLSVVVFFLSLALGLAAGLGSVAAHAELEAAFPPIGGVVPAAPAVVEARFSEEVNPVFTVLTIEDAAGSRVDLSDSAVDLSDPERRRVTVSLRPDVGQGRYTVDWLTRSFVDGHRTEGSFTFTVQTADASPSSGDGAGAAAVGGTRPRVVYPNQVEPDAPSLNAPPFALLASLAVGMGAVLGIWLVWRVVRPPTAKT